jgi:hypothetical protein
MDSLYGLLSESEADIIALVDNRYDTYAYRGLLRKALWSNPDIASKNISNLISRHNAQCKKLEAFPFIPGIPFLKDHMDWGSCIYKDDNLDKSSIFLFRRSGYYYWEVKSTDPDPGFLMLRGANLNVYNYVKLDRPLTAEERLDIIDSLLDSYLIDDDIANITSEIYKAYGLRANDYHVNTLPADITGIRLNDKFDLDMIDALRNADFHYLDINKSIYGISEDTNGNLTYAIGSASNTADVFPIPAETSNGTDYVALDSGTGRSLYSYEANPTNESIANMTRFTHNYKNIDAGVTYIYGLKTEFLTSASVYYYDPDMVNPLQARTFDSSVLLNGNLLECIKWTSPLIAFPVIYVVVVSGNNYTGNYYPMRKDIDNIGWIDNSAMLIYAELDMCYSFMTTKSNMKKDKKAEKKRSKSAKEDGAVE